jgi:hypothetical protein
VKVHTATLAGGTSNADRVFVTNHAVIVLDGASAFAPVDVDPGDYANALGEVIADQLETDPNRDLSQVVAAAIANASTALHLSTGPSPSSTVAILRTRADAADLYVLGDSPIHYGFGAAENVLTDDRMAALGLPEREKYQRELASGAGYTDKHRATLAALQRAQRTHRNLPGGYWIAETDPDAAHHALTATVPAACIAWAVLATDGAADLLDYCGEPAWHEVAEHNADQLRALLERAHEWEATADPDGQLLPRAKQHDDKTVAVIPTIW